MVVRNESTGILCTAEVMSHLHNSRPVNSEDLRVIEERQESRTVNGIFAVERTLCKYGFPRAYVRFPVTGEGNRQISSGMLRLSCPHLVKAVDSYENVSRAIEKFNEAIAQGDDEASRYTANFLATNLAWHRIRKSAVSEEDLVAIEKKLGKVNTDIFMESGITGITLKKVDDVKCMHAHVADELLRGGNLIGQSALKELRDVYGIDSTGCDNCWQQCDIKRSKALIDSTERGKERGKAKQGQNISGESEADTGAAPTTEQWWYIPQKNRHKLRRIRQNRKNDADKRKQKILYKMKGMKEVGMNVDMRTQSLRQSLTQSSAKASSSEHVQRPPPPD